MASPLPARRLLLAVSLSLLGVAGAAAPAGAATVKLGARLPSAAAANGVRLAVDQANTARLVPGVTFSVAANTGEQNLIADGQVAGVVGAADTAAALAELPLANAAPLATVSPSAT